MSDLFYDGVSLSEGTDCELCGWNPDDISIEQWDDGTWYINRSLGCYHGFSEYPDTIEDAITVLEDFRKDQYSLKEHGYYSNEDREALKGLDEMIERVKEYAKANSVSGTDGEGTDGDLSGAGQASVDHSQDL